MMQTGPQPEPCADHHRHRDPQHTGLGLDPKPIGLYLLQLARPQDLLVMNRLIMDARGFGPLPSVWAWKP
jgi:hypothetical protein